MRTFFFKRARYLSYNLAKHDSILKFKVEMLHAVILLDNLPTKNVESRISIKLFKICVTGITKPGKTVKQPQVKPIIKPEAEHAWAELSWTDSGNSVWQTTATTKFQFCFWRVFFHIWFWYKMWFCSTFSLAHNGCSVLYSNVSYLVFDYRGTTTQTTTPIR